MGRYSPHTDACRQEMLAELGLESIEQLLEPISPALRKAEFDLPKGKSELEVRQLLQGLAAQNRNLDSAAAFLGAGCYRHFIPTAVWALVSRGEFLTSYTPYQPEAAQGTLQTIFEFQTGIARLTGMPVANASLYDGASAAAEAVLMALRLQKKRSHLLLADSLHPEYRELLTTYLAGLEVTTAQIPTTDSGELARDRITSLLTEKPDQCAAIVVQYPNFFGTVEDLSDLADIAHEAGALLIVIVTDPTVLAVLKTPGEQGADIVAGEAHCLGTPTSYGGPHLGILAARQEYLRQMPGRLVSLSEDARGQVAYTLTLQTREQHIRRERATSNICTNQSLMASAAAVYMALLGPEGLRQIATTSLQRAHDLASKLQQLGGYEITYSGPFFHEFVLLCPRSAQDLVDRGAKQGIYPGVPLSQWWPERDRELLICTTELNAPHELQQLVNFFKSA